jgi:hypothetical protein
METSGPIRILLLDLLNAIEDHCFFTYFYLDRETGEIIIQSEHRTGDASGETGVVVNDPYPFCDDGERYIPIEPMEGRRGLELMARFIDSMPGGKEKSVLCRQLKKDQPFKNFKNILYDYPEFQAQWHDMATGELKKIAEEWLQYNHIPYDFVSIDDCM